jgi:hypothetical protein
LDEATAKAGGNVFDDPGTRNATTWSPVLDGVNGPEHVVAVEQRAMSWPVVSSQTKIHQGVVWVPITYATRRYS